MEARVLVERPYSIRHALLFASVVLAATDARAVEDEHKRECVAASDESQSARAAGHLLDARQSLLACVRETCPTPVRQFCERWLREVEEALPSIVFRVSDAQGHDLSAVRVLVDGVLVAPSLGGRALSIDPGMHVFRFEPAGAPAFDDRVLVVEAEKLRVITETVPRAPSPIVVSSPVTPALAPTPDGPRAGPPAGFYALGGVGVAALGAFAYFAATGQSDYSACAREGCSNAMRDSIDTRRALAWTSLGIGIVALGVGAVLWIASAQATKPARRAW
jgi:hypothetical protein